MRCLTRPSPRSYRDPPILREHRITTESRKVRLALIAVSVAFLALVPGDPTRQRLLRGLARRPRCLFETFADPDTLVGGSA